MRIGIIGAEGKLGSHLIHMGCEPLPVWIEKDMPWVDFPTKDAVIINCAAMTEVDRCETDEEYYKQAAQSNGWGVEYLAKAYAGEIIHISTDYVFGGRHGAYDERYSFDKHENDLPAKNMAYGFTKFFGECTAMLYNNVRIVRTTGLYGGISPKNDFLNMIIDGYSIGVPEILVTKELRGNQTYIPHLAEALIQYAKMCANGSQNPKVLHIASKEVISRYEFALMIADVFGLDKKKIKPCRNKDVPGWVAERPKKGGLKVKLAQKMGLPIYTILEGLQDAKKHG